METVQLSSQKMDVNGGFFLRKLALCRICHDEDESTNMEAPCACCGSLKYAHRRCVQMWCNQKGNTICEICLQPFKPGYTVPPPRLPFAIIPVPLREPWEFASRNQYDHPSLVAAETFFDHRLDDYTAPTASIICCRVVTIIFLVMIVLRHTLPIVMDGAGEYSFTLYTLLMLRTIGIVLPMFVMLKACSIIRNHRRHRQTPATLYRSTSDEDNELVRPDIPAHVIRIQ
ncbi:uncharacterized protein LOC130804189 [Amaranthus tricolor]|uniref:uncharacterized protein LOC130804189 n=1 Tax=Amaranthus tricolor TaxID=29722 RepID=UPI002587F733|nr:uncharacterized protein LOC130804189 [Amaranthus tricolor]XP_057524530.1 uncharacterized protein LOC130804189 [Amaranthus tricolor]